MKLKHFISISSVILLLTSCNNFPVRKTDNFTIIWKNYDGTVLEVDNNVKKDIIPTYDGETPTREADPQYSYTFSGWSPSVTKANKDTTYTATYKEETNKYTVTWRNIDGTVLETDNDVPYGSAPTYNGEVPKKDSTAEYEYVFTGWSPKPIMVTGNLTYTAQYGRSTRNYNITWQNYDGTVLESDSVPYGLTPSYKGNTPVKESTEEYNYVFSGWSPSIATVTEDATYIAQFNIQLNDCIYALNDDGESYKVTGLRDKTIANVTILSSINGKPVTSIVDSAFSGCSSLSSIVIPNSITSIGQYVFNNCTSLSTVNIPDSITSLATGTFARCSSLSSIIIPSSVASIGNHCFSGCSSLSSITITSGVTSIGLYAFENCSSLSSITIPDSITNIEGSAFSNCSSLSSITIPSSVTSIGVNVFNGCSSLNSFIVESGNTKYDSRDNCNAIIYTSINKLIYGCKNTIIPASVTTIGENAFNGRPLSSINISKNVSYIYSSAFSYCPSLSSIVVDSENSKYDSRDNCNAIVETSKNTLITGCKNTIIPSSVTSIDFSAFRGCSSLISITIPSSVTIIGYSSFSECTSLSSVEIYGNISSIGNYAFSKCSSLASINIPTSVTSIGASAFYYCSSLPSIIIPNSVTSIGDNAFYYCSSLSTIDLTNLDHVITGGSAMFTYCKLSAGSIKVPSSLLSSYKSAQYWSTYADYIIGV